MQQYFFRLDQVLAVHILLEKPQKWTISYRWGLSNWCLIHKSLL